MSAIEHSQSALNRILYMLSLALKVNRTACQLHIMVRIICPTQAQAGREGKHIQRLAPASIYICHFERSAQLPYLFST